jgi:hypothetical protein
MTRVFCYFVEAHVRDGRSEVAAIGSVTKRNSSTSVDAWNSSSELYTVSTRHRFSSSLLSAASSVCGLLSSSIPGLGRSAAAGGLASGSPHSSATTGWEFPESAPYSSSLMGGSGFEGVPARAGSARPTRRVSRPRCPGPCPRPRPRPRTRLATPGARGLRRGVREPRLWATRAAVAG